MKVSPKLKTTFLICYFLIILFRIFAKVDTKLFEILEKKIFKSNSSSQNILIIHIHILILILEVNKGYNMYIGVVISLNKIFGFLVYKI